MSRRIDREKCIGCGICENICLVGCVSQGEKEKRVIEESACVDCGACQLACPVKCINIV
ncbi:MAG: 4Fe-4S binding protein [Fusobacteriaceae bacterium]